MKFPLQKFFFIGSILILFSGCMISRTDNSWEIPEELSTACAAFNAKTGVNRTAEAIVLSSVILKILFDYTVKTEVSPGVWRKKIDTNIITSPLTESVLISLIGKPDKRTTDSLSYITNKSDAEEGRQSRYIVIYLRNEYIVATGGSTSSSYY